MAKITFKFEDTSIPTVVVENAEEGYSILEVTEDFDIHLNHNCGGVCACSTCHIYVNKGEDSLEEISDKEEDFIDRAINPKLESRLACQCIILDDDAEIEMNIKSKKTTVSLLKSAEAKSVIVGEDATFDLYQKSQAKVEGDCNNMILRLDNNASFAGKSFVVKQADLTVEESCSAEVNVKDLVKIDASGKTEVVLFNDPKIEMIRFSDNAVLRKKSSK